MYNPFETQQIEEIIPVDYENFLDELEVEAVRNRQPLRCIKCGATVTLFELNINDGRCPCCDSILVEKDILI